MLSPVLARLQRIADDPSRIVDYLRAPRLLVRGSPWMNHLGLQAMRAVKEQVVWQLRPTNTPPHLTEHLAVLERDGFIKIENFLAPEAMREIDAEMEAIERLPNESFRHSKFGPNYASRFFMVSRRTEYSAFAKHLRDNELIYDLARAVARRPRSYKPHINLQWVYKPDPDAPHQDFEYNSYLHVDRHYPFLKAFFYLRDVDIDCAPYTFVRGSHRFTSERLRFEYKLGVGQSQARARKKTASVDPEQQKDRDRVMEHLARELHLRSGLEEVPITGKKNTLIISNNRGLHRRWEMTGKGPRVTANLDYKFFESPAQPLYPLLRYIETPTKKALAW
jgi:hypothetical protein